MSGSILFFTFLVAAALSGTFTGAALWFLKRQAILDMPNNRSSHSLPTPRGGGLGVIAALLVMGGAIVFSQLPEQGDLARGLLGTLALAVVLGLISWLDDLYSLSPAPRFAAQIIAVGLGVTLLPNDMMVFQGLLPVWADHLLAGFLWLWFVNLTNFMDGIDGITATETGSIGLGLALVFGLILNSSDFTLLALSGAALAGVSLGFYAWNRPPAKVFMGDVGSVPLGFVLGWVLLSTAAQGFWAVALILPLYYLADATLTLIKRISRREKIWQAHRSHFYQQAVQVFEGPDGASRTPAHRHILAVIALCNLILIGLAVVAATKPDQSFLLLLAATLAVGLLLWYLASRKRDHKA